MGRNLTNYLKGLNNGLVNKIYKKNHQLFIWFLGFKEKVIASKSISSKTRKQWDSYCWVSCWT